MEQFCKYCHKPIPHYPQTHYRYCVEYNTFIDQIKLKLTREFLEEEYLNKGKSSGQIHREFNIEKKGLVDKYLDKYDIKRRNAKERAQNLGRQLQTKNTCVAKYGVEHHLSHPDIIKKREATVQETYGVQNVFQAKEIKDLMKQTNLKNYGVEFASQSDLIRDKVKSTNLERYGYDNPWKVPSIITKLMDNRILNGNPGRQYSKCSQRFFWKLYENLPVELQMSTYFAELNKEFGKRTDEQYYFYDFAIPSIKYCLEYNGTYFHADPTRYPAHWVNKKLKLTAEEIWANDVKKIDLIKSYGFTVDILWQSEDESTALERIIKSISTLSQTLSNNECSFGPADI